jgi:DNA-binding transcriptional ArsR family regulator
MVKVTLDLDSFKALASETRLDVLKALDGKKLSLNDISKATNLHKVTLHEHLGKLVESGFVKRSEREGHKWVYYKLTWKGECLLHPENTRIVVLFSTTFLLLFLGIVGLINYMKKVPVMSKSNSEMPEYLIKGADRFEPTLTSTAQNPLFFYIALGCLILFSILCVISIWRYKKNKLSKF